MRELMEGDLNSKDDVVDDVSETLAAASLQGEGQTEVTTTDRKVKEQASLIKPKVKQQTSSNSTDEGNGEGIPAAEANGGETTGARAEPTKSGGDVTSVRDVPTAEANLLTFSRQKLAMLQCEYDPKCCSHCKKPASSEGLKSCSKCKTAKYCSRECQAQDWRARHKEYCKEISRLQRMIHQDQDIPVTLHHQSRRIKAVPEGKPWSLDKDFDYYKLCTEDDKLFVVGYHTYTKARTVLMYNAATGTKEGTVSQLSPQGSVIGMCKVKASIVGPA